MGINRYHSQANLLSKEERQMPKAYRGDRGYQKSILNNSLFSLPNYKQIVFSFYIINYNIITIFVINQLEVLNRRFLYSSFEVQYECLSLFIPFRCFVHHVLDPFQITCLKLTEYSILILLISKYKEIDTLTGLYSLYEM